MDTKFTAKSLHAVDIHREKYLRRCQKYMAAPCRKFANSLTLTCVDLRHQSLGYYSLKVICGTINTNIFIKELILKGNRVHDRLSIDLYRLLRNNSHLKTIDLSDNQLSDKGFEKIGDGLEENNTLLKLNLSGKLLLQVSFKNIKILKAFNVLIF